MDPPKDPSTKTMAEQPDAKRAATSGDTAARPSASGNESGASETNAANDKASQSSGSEPRGAARAAAQAHEGRNDNNDGTVDYAAKIAELDKVIEGGQFNAQKSTREEREEFYRRRNALYSQRKYYRKKLKIQKLEQERDRLSVKNQEVRTENAELERTLSWAIEKVKLHLLETTRGPLGAAGAATVNPLLAQASIATAGLPSNATASDLLLSRLLGAQAGNPSISDLLAQQQQQSAQQQQQQQQPLTTAGAGNDAAAAANIQSLLQSLGATGALGLAGVGAAGFPRATALQRVLAQSAATNPPIGAPSFPAAFRRMSDPRLEQLALQQALLVQQQSEQSAAAPGTTNPQGLQGLLEASARGRSDSSSSQAAGGGGGGLSLQDALQGIGGGGQQELWMRQQLGSYGAASLAGAALQQQQASLSSSAAASYPGLHSVTPPNNNNNAASLTDSPSSSQAQQQQPPQQQQSAALQQLLQGQVATAASSSMRTSELLRALEEQKVAEQLAAVQQQQQAPAPAPQDHHSPGQ